MYARFVTVLSGGRGRYRETVRSEMAMKAVQTL